METETPPDYEAHRSSAGPSWPLLLALTAVLVFTAVLMAWNVWYTGGMNGQVLHGLAIIATLLCLLIGFRSRMLAAWLILACGGGAILWHADQSRRWGLMQEEVIAILHHANQQKKENGRYPPSLEGYAFRRPELRDRISYSFHEGKLTVAYKPGSDEAAYWHHEDGGFCMSGD